MPDSVTLLVVDDSKPNRDMLARRLTREGYAVLTADSGREALEVIAHENVTLVLLDLMMPEMNGIEVLQELRKSHGDIVLPVVMVSANNDSPQMVAAIDVGANDYVTKPLDFDLLLAKIRRHLRIRAGVSSAGTVAPVKHSELTEALAISPGGTLGYVPPASFAPLQAGQTLGHYRLLEMLGEGGMGQVYLAEDTRLLRQVALKVMIGDVLPKDCLERFVLEAQAVARVNHPGVVTIYEIAMTPRYYIAMERIKGEPLQKVTDGKPLDPARAIRLIRQVLEALSVVHEAGVTHRDLKPSNIMICANDRVKVLDFGLAKLEGSDLKLTQTGQVWGTPQYMSPEQIDPEFGKIDAQTDVFGAACIFYELLVGHPPFTGKTLSKLIFEILSKQPPGPEQLNPDVSVELAGVVMGGLRKEKNKRWASCQVFIEELDKLSGGSSGSHPGSIELGALP